MLRCITTDAEGSMCGAEKKANFDKFTKLGIYKIFKSYSICCYSLASTSHQIFKSVILLNQQCYVNLIQFDA